MNQELQKFPAVVYHADNGPKLVENEAEKAVALTEGYSDQPITPPEPKPAVARVDSVQALEDRVIALESIVAELQAEKKSKPNPKPAKPPKE